MTVLKIVIHTIFRIIKLRFYEMSNDYQRRVVGPNAFIYLVLKIEIHSKFCSYCQATVCFVEERKKLAAKCFP